MLLLFLKYIKTCKKNKTVELVTQIRREVMNPCSPCKNSIYHTKDLQNARFSHCRLIYRGIRLHVKIINCIIMRQLVSSALLLMSARPLRRSCLTDQQTYQQSQVESSVAILQANQRSGESSQSWLCEKMTVVELKVIVMHAQAACFKKMNYLFLCN